MKYPEELKQALRRLRREGWTYGQLSKLSGLQARTIHRWCNKESKEAADRSKKKWYLKNHERCRRVAKSTYWKNAEKNRKRMKAWRDANKDRVLLYARQYKQNNPAIFRLQELIKRAKKRQVPHAYSKIEKLMVKYRYEDARKLTKETGIKYEVDHIIPISKGGPHLPWNLQVITARENRQKYNKI